MSSTVERECKKCGKVYERSWKEFSRWLRKNKGRPPEDYLCPSCTIATRNWKHGDSKTVLYGRWKAMFARTKGQSLEANKKYYVAKGIKVCEEWYDYKNFEQWAKTNGFDPALVIDRIDGNGNYEPANCRWVTSKENNNNRNQPNAEELDQRRDKITGQFTQKPGR